MIGGDFDEIIRRYERRYLPWYARGLWPLLWLVLILAATFAAIVLAPFWTVAP